MLGIETSGRSGSVALLEEDRVIAFREHAEENQHAERIFQLIHEVLAEAGWDRRSLTRIAVSRGPGAFTAIRIGMAVADGLGLGLGIEVVTVNSLEALAMSPFVVLGGDGPRRAERELTVALRDARREEYFVSIFDARGERIFGPEALATRTAKQEILARVGERTAYFIGEPAETLGLEPGLPSAFYREDPDARAVAILGVRQVPRRPLEPEYVRGPNVVKPELPVSPLSGSSDGLSLADSDSQDSGS